MLKHAGDLRAVKATNGPELFEILDNQHVACIVLDYDLDGETGLSIGQSIMQKYADPPPIIMLTGMGSERTATKAFRIGFSDYVCKKNLDARELVSAIHGAISRHQEQRALRQEVERLRGQQRQDSLTGLYTDAHMHGRLDELALGRSAPGFTLIAISIAEIGTLREHLGEAAIGRLVKEFAARLAGTNLPGAFLGHLGTHEFACVFEGELDSTTLAQHGAQIRREATITLHDEGLRLEAVPRIGSASFPRDGADVSAVIAAAREAADAESEATEADAAAAPLPAEQADEAAPVQSDRRRKPEQRVAQRRAEQRHRVLKKGKILIHALNTVIDCAIRNVSPSGAQIRVPGYFVPPRRFELLLADSDEARWVNVRWQVAGDIGVEFA